MANPIIQAVYDLKDQISAKIKVINDALRANKKVSDQTTDATERNQKRASDAYKKTASDLDSFRKGLIALGAFVGLDKLKDTLLDILNTGEGFDDLRKKFDTAFGGVEAGGAAFEKVKALAATVPQSFEDVSAAAIALRKAGFDPLDGSLQALIDNANATNQSQEELIGTIEALGKANIKGAVNIKALVSLTESGIPVFDLLGKSMGISADRVRELANSGKLGSDSIKLLVTELGKLRAGAAADEMGDLDSQVSKLKDQVREFFDQIAKSGALQFFRDELKDLNDEVAAAAADGRLKNLAKSIGDGIVTAANAVKTIVGLIADYSGALITLLKIYAGFRAFNIAKNFLDSAAAIEIAGEKAAKAGAKVGGLSGALKSIPSQIKIGLAIAGLEFTLGKLIELGHALDDLRDTNKLVADTNSDLARTMSDLRAKIETTKAAYGGFADVALQSAEELKGAGEEQLASYAEQLEGARKFYQAIALQAKLAGDAVGMADAKEKIAAISAELVEVNQQLAVTKAVGSDAASGLTEGAKKIVEQLDEVKNEAKATGDFIEKQFTDLDLTQPTVAIGDFAAAFDTVAAKGGKAAETLDKTLLESLKKLSGPELLNFQSSAIAAIDKLGEGAEKTSATLKASLEAELDRLGVKAEDTGTKITKSGADTIATFQAVTENVQASAKTIGAAFDAALKSVKTPEEVKSLGDTLKAAFERGAIGAKELSSATRDLDERLRTLQAAVNPLASQFDLLGIKSQAALIAARDNAKEAFDAIVEGARNGTAAQEDVVRAFEAWAAAARDAAKDSDHLTKDQVEQTIEFQASVLGLTDQLKKAGDAGSQAGDAIADGMVRADAALTDAAAKARALGDAIGHENGDEFAARTQAWADSLQNAANAAASAAAGVVLLSADQQRAINELSKEVEQGGVTLQQYEERMAEVFSGVNASIERQLADMERLRKIQDDLLQQIANESGDPVAEENARHEQKLKDLKEETTTADGFNLQAYLKLKKLEDELHAKKLANIKAQQQAQASGGSGGGSSEASGGAGTSSGDSAPKRATAINITPNVLLLGNDPKAAKQLTSIIIRDVAEGLAKLDGLSR